jgi:hypothetical protein
MRLVVVTLLGFLNFTSVFAQAPPRDTAARPPVAGTAVIKGRVIAADTKRPLRRARITLMGGDLGPQSRMANTDADGRYELTEVPAGRYTLRVTRGGYLALRYGQRDPNEQGKPVELRDKEVVENVDFSLPRMSVISGRVVDELGDPIEGVNVYASRPVFFEGRRQLVPVAGGPPVRTDDTGQFRLLGLAPGSYLVSAVTRETWTTTTDGMKREMGYMPTYFPGTANQAEAQKITVRAGQEVVNTDFGLILGRAVKISGTAFDSQGRPFPNVNLTVEVRGPEFGSFSTAGSATVKPDGTFTIQNVPPGDYVLSAATGRNTPDAEAAFQSIRIDGTDVENIALTGSRGGRITGVITTEDGPLSSLTRVSVTAMPPLMGQPSPVLIGTFRSPGRGQIDGDGRFEVPGVFGSTYVRLEGLPDTWALKAVLHDGRDLIDVPLTLGSNETLTDVQVVITNRVTSVGGDVRDAKGAPVSEGTVIVFPADSSRWEDHQRFIRSTRLDQKGLWNMKGLPEGEYLAVALDFVEEGRWADPEFLDTLRPQASKVTLTPDAPQNLSLRVRAVAR